MADTENKPVQEETPITTEVKSEDVKVEVTEEPKAEEPKAEEHKAEEHKEEEHKEEEHKEEEAAEEKEKLECVLIEVSGGSVNMSVLVNLSSPSFAFSLEQLSDVLSCMKQLRK